jgi:hypothetical protein
VSAACLETRLGAGRVARPSQDASVPRAVRVTNGQPWHREPSRRGGRCTRPELRRAKADHHALLEATDRLAPSIPAKRPAPETRRSAAVRRGAHRALSKRPPTPPSDKGRSGKQGALCQSIRRPGALGAASSAGSSALRDLRRPPLGNGEPAPLLALEVCRRVDPLRRGASPAPGWRGRNGPRTR